MGGICFVDLCQFAAGVPPDTANQFIAIVNLDSSVRIISAQIGSVGYHKFGCDSADGGFFCDGEDLITLVHHNPISTTYKVLVEYHGNTSAAHIGETGKAYCDKLSNNDDEKNKADT